MFISFFVAKVCVCNVQKLTLKDNGTEIFIKVKSFRCDVPFQAVHYKVCHFCGH